jgi:hypothetical protein
MSGLHRHKSGRILILAVLSVLCEETLLWHDAEKYLNTERMATHILPIILDPHLLPFLSFILLAGIAMSKVFK